MTEIRVQPRSVYEHHLCTKTHNVTINWTFSTKKKTIYFGLYYKPQSSSSRGSMDEQKKKRNKSVVIEDHHSNHYYHSDTDDGNKRSTSVANPSIKDSSSSIYSRNRRKSSVHNLLDNDFTELIAMEQVSSSKDAIVGSYLAEEPGNYILLFDNKFSRNTPKFLTLDVSTDETSSDEAFVLDYDMSGYLLKKRRKKMQGWAKRWFELSSSGVLSYSVRKGSTRRGSIQTLLATISVSPKQRIIHLDSGTTIFHLKALSLSTFNQWLSCIRELKTHHMNTEWNEDIQSAISIRSEENITTNHHEIIIKALQDLDVELKYLNNLVLSTQQDHNLPLPSPTINDSSPPPPPLPHSNSSSGNSIKLRFPFKRMGSSSSHSDDKSTNSIIINERLYQSIKSMMENKEKILTAYNESINTLPIRSSTAFTSHKANSFYSYGDVSDVFFDAESFILSGDDEEGSLYGSIQVDSEEEADKEELFIELNNKSKDLISRRTTLPHPVAVKKLSLLGLLRKFIGKDLTNIPLPIILNEPLNLLQRLCEELEYCELLDHASKQSSSIDRLIYVTAFAISGYAATHYRLGRKPFNPLLCETYECVRPDKGFRFISEKVSHTPNTMACHASSKNFEFRQAFTGAVEFWGQSMELTADGQGHISLTGHQDQFTYTKPPSFTRNLFTGTKYLEHVGDMKVVNHTTGEYAIVKFKEAKTGGSFFSTVTTDRNRIEARFFDNNDNLIRQVEGKWSETISELISPNQYKVIWRSNAPKILDPLENYGFTEFATELNETTLLEKDKLPITDSRNRKDQSLFENGKVSEAEDEKIRVEQLQRDRRNQGQISIPLWFEMKEDPFHPKGESWQYKGGYWEARNTGQWPKETLKLW